MVNDTALSSQSLQAKSLSHRVAVGTTPDSSLPPIPPRGTAALVATFARYPQSQSILTALSQYATGKGYGVCGQVKPLDDWRRITAIGDTATGLSPERFPGLRCLEGEYAR